MPHIHKRNFGRLRRERLSQHKLCEPKVEGTLEEQVERAHEIIGDMASETRGPKMTIPAGSALNRIPCGDEDMYLTQVIDNLYDEVNRLREHLNYINHIDYL